MYGLKAAQRAAATPMRTSARKLEAALVGIFLRTNTSTLQSAAVATPYVAPVQQRRGR